MADALCGCGHSDAVSHRRSRHDALHGDRALSVCAFLLPAFDSEHPASDQVAKEPRAVRRRQGYVAMSLLYVSALKTPLGWLELEADDEALLKVHFVSQKPQATDENTILREARKQLNEYFEG